ncbi:adenylate/guanylate cyclase domain-containing protein [Maribacter aestuarii]|uniref:adenylate/guanylate cyclase domain-containing protein n=1 Tax=Maribacter aestuarii TaxID=1130723 RepID=UPI00248CBA7C|nr:adenylate/guanylate cyclase domain-containing protein [Maribacter aestuarii]
MRSTLLTIFVFLQSFFVTLQLDAQEPKLDSLKTVVKQKKRDSTIVNALLEISTLLARSEPEESKEYAQKAIDMAKAIKFTKGQAYGYKNLGLLLYFKGELNKELIDLWKKSLDLFKEIEFKTGISNLQNNLGSVYQTKGDDPTALAYFLKSLRLAEEIKDPFRISTAYLNIGGVYSNEKATYEQALEAYNKSKEIFEEIDYYHGAAYAAINIAEIQLNTNNPEAALKGLEDSMELFDKNDTDFANVLIMIGRAYEDMGKPKIAETNYLNAIEIALSNDAKMEASKAYIKLADMYRSKNLPSKALDQYQNALKLTESTKIFRDKRDIYAGLAQVHAQLGDYQNAFNFQKQFSAVRDTIKNDDYEATLGNLRFQFDIENKEKEIELLNAENKVKEVGLERAAISKKYFYAVAALLFAIALGAIMQYRFVKKSNKKLAQERNKAEQILLNILPKETAEELKLHGSVKAKEFKQITVLFTDFKAFSVIAEEISAEALVRSVDYYFKKFDEITQRHGLEKIKTIGDAYMCAGGLPTENTTHAFDAFNAAQEILKFVEDTLKNPPEGIYPFQIRIGLNTGPVVAGVVGTKKFQYDIWGNTVNIAARMESNSIPGKINISENTHEILKNEIDFTYRGIISVKNSKKLKMYFAGKDVQEPVV